METSEVSDWYILNEDKTTRRANDTPDDKNLAYRCVNIVAQEHVGKVWVSTVFLGLDHSFGQGDPILFETMVFRDGHGEECERYCTWQEAEAGHRRVCEGLTSGFTREELGSAKTVIEDLISNSDK